jgi:hypothetical protein
VIVSAAHSVVVGWFPLGDDAVIAARSYDVPTTHTPLLGQFSASSGILGSHSQYSLGPMLYWLLAVPARLLGPSALVVTVGLVATASIVGCVILAQRRGGNVFMVATAIVILVASRSLDPETLSDVWNPAAALFPFLLLMFATWSIASGDTWLLPVAVVLASFVAQCHLTYVLPALGMLAVAVGAVLITRAPGARRAFVVAAVAGAVCWSAPLLEQAVHRPGNLVQVARAATAGEPTLGASAGWHAVVRTAGVEAWWLRPPRTPFGRLVDVTTRPPAAGIITAALILAMLTAAAVVGLRRRRADLAAGALIALVGCLAAGAIAASTPSKGNLFISIGYTLWWASFAGAFAVLICGWAAVELAGSGLRPARAAVPALYAGIAAAATIAVLVAARTGPERLQSAYRPVRAAVDRLADERGPAVVEPGASNELFLQFDVQAGLVYGLRANGVRVMAKGLPLGGWYEPTAVQNARTVKVSSPRADSGRVMATMRIHEVPYGQAPAAVPLRTIAISTEQRR